MQTNSRDGKFILSAPDNAKTGCRLDLDYSQYDEVIDVDMEAIEENVTLWDVACAINSDCFSWDGVGLRLLTKILRCHLTVGKNKYDFTVKWNNSLTRYIEQLAMELKL